MIDAISRTVPVEICNGLPFCLPHLHQTLKQLASEGFLHLWEQIKVTNTHVQRAGCASFSLLLCERILHRCCHMAVCSAMQWKWWSSCGEMWMVWLHSQMQVILQKLSVIHCQYSAVTV